MEVRKSTNSKRMIWMPSVENSKLFFDLYFTNFIQVNQSKIDFIETIVDSYYDKISTSMTIENKPIKVVRGAKKGSKRLENRLYCNISVRVWEETYIKIYKLYNTFKRDNSLFNFYQIIENIILYTKENFENQGIEIINNSHFYTDELKEILEKTDGK